MPAWTGPRPTRSPALRSSRCRPPRRWEIGIKQAIGKLAAPDDLSAELATNGFTELPVTVAHALAAGALPPHHC